MDRFQHEMTQEKPQVERRVARVGALEIEQNQAVRVHKDVLGAEVAQNERSLVGGALHRRYQGVNAPATSGWALAAVR